MNPARKKLIEELIRVGRLIDPVPSARQQSSEDAEKLPRITQKSNMDTRFPVEDLEQLPLVDDVVNRPYTTKDMFANPVNSYVSRSVKPLEEEPQAANTSSSEDAPVSTHIGLVDTNSEEQLSQEIVAIEFPAEELARELVTLIEDRVSQRSGEQLDDAFRDELTQAVIGKLEGWLKHD